MSGHLLVLGKQFWVGKIALDGRADRCRSGRVDHLAVAVDQLLAPVRVVMTARPEAIASSTTLPSASVSDGTTRTEASR